MGKAGIRLLVAVATLAAACTSGDSSVADQAAATATAVVAEPTVVSAATPDPTPEPSSAGGGADGGLQPRTITDGLQPLGTYGVARSGAGEPWWMPAGSENSLPTLAVPVFDEPGGMPRTLLEVNAIDGVESLLPLLNWAEFDSPLAVRVLEISADGEWLRIQAPTRPHNTSAWVRAASFELHVTSQRIEIDLATATLTLFDGEQVVLESGIVHGRPTRETPTHVTYVQDATPGAPLSPAYGAWRISIASFSEQLGTFGGGNSPRNFIHGTNAPELMGMTVSSGEVRVPDAIVEQLVETIVPGTPVIIFESNDLRSDRAAVLARPFEPAATAAFDDFGPGMLSSLWRESPQAWRPCDAVGGSCRNPDATPIPALIPPERIVQSTYLIARDDAGAPSDWRGGGHRVIPVYDRPGGPPRMLVDVNAIDGTELPAPLLHPTVFDQPLVLPIVSGDYGSGWMQVRVPVRPNGSTVWVRSEDFTFHGTDVRIEFDLGDSSLGAVGVLRVFDGDELLIETTTRSGRESRPTPLGQGWVSQIIIGDRLSPAYGPFVIDQGRHSEALGSFGGGGQPRMSMSGTNQPDTVGMQVSSGGFRMLNESITAIVETPGIIGAPIFVYDSTGSTHSSAASVGAFTTPATTIDPIIGVDPLIPSFA